jgi:pyruvate dehydrogenase E2 component (dihydrolipoamide acetyltransferase)
VITRADVTRAAANSTTATRPEPAVAPPAARAPLAPSAPAALTRREVPLQGIRARIAERMTAAHAEIPDAAATVEADCSQLLAIRDRLRRSSHPGAEAVTPFALVLRLLVATLLEHPILNSRLDADARVIRLQESVHLGVGTSTDRGLVVPVVRDAQRLTTLELAQEVRRLAEWARAGTLPPAELVGSTFTVSNFGSFGLDDGIPIINHPEVAILGVGAIRPRAVVVDGIVAARPTARLSCAFDHRVLDGAEVGGFLARLRELVETPALLLLDH